VKTKKIKLYNDFHGTEVTLRVKNNIVTPCQVKRAWRELCGIKGCTCGDQLGGRGPQEVQYNIYLKEGTVYARIV